MKINRIVILGIAMAIIALTGIAWAANPEKEQGAVTAAAKWLTLIDTGKYSESWREANAYFKQSVKQDQWGKIIQSVRTKSGKVISRTLKTQKNKTAFLPGEPKGRYIIVQYATSFQNKKSVSEEVVVILEKNGQWKVSGYHLK